MQYIKNESLPIYKEAYQELKPEIKDAINTINDNDTTFNNNCRKRL